MRLYKLTNQQFKTRKFYPQETTWGSNVAHTATGSGVALCTPDVIHAYTSPLLAVLLNPIHADIVNPILWEARGKVVAQDGSKVGVKSLTTIRQIPLPEITTTQKVAFGILAAMKVYKNPAFQKWAKLWLSGKDRSWAAAAAARAAAAAAAARAKFSLANIARKAMTYK